MLYIEMHRGPAAYVLGPPPSRDLELEGGVNACHVEYVYESRESETPTCEVPSNGVVEISLLSKLRFRLGPVTQKLLAHCTAR